MELLNSLGSFRVGTPGNQELQIRGLQTFASFPSYSGFSEPPSRDASEPDRHGVVSRLECGSNDQNTPLLQRRKLFITQKSEPGRSVTPKGDFRGTGSPKRTFSKQKELASSLSGSPLPPSSDVEGVKQPLNSPRTSLGHQADTGLDAPLSSFSGVSKIPPSSRPSESPRFASSGLSGAQKRPPGGATNVILGSSRQQPNRVQSLTLRDAENRPAKAAAHQSGVHGQQGVAMEERRKVAETLALEKAEQLKQDAKVVSWITLKRQLNRGEPAAGVDLVDKINLSHLDAKDLPRAKDWQTRSLVKMVESIVWLVCKANGGVEATSLLTPLLAVAGQAHVEDCDLAIHAEMETARRALLRLCAPSRVGSAEGRDGKAGEEAALEEGGMHQGNILSEREPSFADDRGTEGGSAPVAEGIQRAGKGALSKAAPRKAKQSGKKQKKKGRDGDVSSKTKAATRGEDTMEKGKMGAGITLAREPPRTLPGDIDGSNLTEGDDPEARHPRVRRDGAYAATRLGRFSVPTLSSSVEAQVTAPPKVTRVHRRAELEALIEAKAQAALVKQQRKRKMKGLLARSHSEPRSSGDSYIIGHPLIPQEKLRRCFTDVEDFRVMKGQVMYPFHGLLGCYERRFETEERHQSLRDLWILPPNLSFLAVKEKLKRYMLAEAKGLELARGEKKSYKEWLRHYYGEERVCQMFGSFTGEQGQPPTASKQLKPASKVAIRMGRLSVPPTLKCDTTSSVE